MKLAARARGLFDKLERFVLAACSDPADAECRRQAWLVHSFSILGFLVTGAFLAAALVAGRHRLAGLLLLIDAVSLGGLLYFRRFRNALVASSVALVTLGLFFLYLLASGEVEGYGFLWTFTYPPLVLFCLGSRIGLPLVGVFVGLAGWLVVAPAWSGVVYPGAFQVRWVSALLFVATSSALFEWTRSKTQRRLVAEIAERHRAEAELQAAKDLAERTARAKGDFLANMSHELRTPLTSLIGMTDLLLAKELRPDLRVLARTMQHSCLHLVDITSDVLDLSKLEAGRLVLEPVCLEPAALTREVVESFEAVAAAKDLDLALDVAGLPACVRVDARRVRQVLNNLIGNAIKFTARGGVRVRVEAETGSTRRVRLRWSVSDSGPGVPAHLQAAIFEEFRQGERTAGGPCGGTGLGLTISQRLIEAMGGSIGVISQSGDGSQFWFALEVPLADSEEHDAAASEAAWPPPERELQSTRLLVAEDDPNNRSLMQLVFERLGAQVELACDGREAVEKYDAGEFDLILMDCSMPRMDGYEATSAIRRRQVDQGRRRVPILAITANVTEENHDRCLSSGMDGTLLKPFQADQLERVVSSFLTR